MPEILECRGFRSTIAAAAVLSWCLLVDLTFPGFFDGAQLLRQLPSKSLLPSGETSRFGQVSRSGGPTNQRLQLVTRDITTTAFAVCYFMLLVVYVYGVSGRVGYVGGDDGVLAACTRGVRLRVQRLNAVNLIFRSDAFLFS